MRLVSYAAVLLAGILIQWWWPTYGSVFGLAPQTLLVLTVAFSSQVEPAVSESVAFVWGLFLDVMVGTHLFGGNALSLTLTSYCVGMARRQMDVSNPLSQAMVAAVVSWIYFLFLSLLGLVFKGNTFWVGWKTFCFDPVLNGLIAPFGFYFVRRYLRP